MTEKNTESFRLSWSWLLVDGVFIAIIACAATATLGVNLIGIFLGVALFVILFGTLVFGFAVRVHDAGIDYGLFNQLLWQDVSSARFRKFVGLPYLFIERQNKSGWWLPLYLRGNRPLVESLADKAPEGSPIKQLLTDR
jgi:hypothetical protein